MISLSETAHVSREIELFEVVQPFGYIAGAGPTRPE